MVNGVVSAQTEHNAIDLNQVSAGLQNISSSKKNVSPIGSASTATTTPRTPGEPVLDTTPRTYCLYFRKYSWFLQYTVKLNEDGTVNQERPLEGKWIQLNRQLTEAPKMSELPGMIIDGSEESISYAKGAWWNFSGTLEEDGKIAGRINVASKAKMLMVVTPQGVCMRIDGRDVEVTHLWVYLSYFLGAPNPLSIKTYLYLEDTCVQDGETSS